MASTKISALTAGTPSVATDRLPIARGGSNFYLALSDIWTLPSSSKLAVPGAQSTSSPDLYGASSNTGFTLASSAVYFISGANNRFILADTEARAASGVQFSWSSSATDAAAADTGLARASAGVVKITDGSTGYGSVYASLYRTYDGSGNNSTEANPTTGYRVGGNYQYVFSATGNNAGAGADTGLARSAAGIVRTSNGSTGLGYGISGHAITTSTSGPVTINIIDSGQLYTNTGAGGAITYNLPNDPTIGSYYRFAVMAAQAMDITPAAGESIRDAASTGTTKITANTVGNILELVAITGGSGAVWLVLSKTGAWTLT